MTLRPTATEPVNETRSTAGCSVRACPASALADHEVDDAPGISASSAIRANAIAESGVRGEGNSTVVQPGRRAPHRP